MNAIEYLVLSCACCYQLLGAVGTWCCGYLVLWVLGTNRYLVLWVLGTNRYLVLWVLGAIRYLVLWLFGAIKKISSRIVIYGNHSEALLVLTLLENLCVDAQDQR